MIEQLANQASSIGAVWPPVLSSHERLRGFYSELLESAGETELFIGQFKNYIGELDTIEGASKLSIRVLATKESVNRLDEQNITIEGAIPISVSGSKGDDLFVVYAGYNPPDRQISEAKINKHRLLLDSVVSEDVRGNHTTNVEELGMHIQVVDENKSEENREKLLNKFLALYKIFGYDIEDVREILSNNSITIIFIEDSEGIASTAAAEKAIIPIKGFGNLEMIEITEAYTRPDVRGRGLYRAVSSKLVQFLLENSAIPHVLYGESNLAMIGVIKAAHQNGRRFNYFDREDLGISQNTFGILQQNFRIEDGVECRSYNDFAISYYNLDKFL